MSSVHSAETIKNVCELYREGFTAAAIAERFYLRRNQVVGILGRAGASRQPQPAKPRATTGTYHDDDWMNWRDHTRARLEWIYGFEKARRVIHGVDLETQSDIAKWNTLGRRRGAA